MASVLACTNGRGESYANEMEEEEGSPLLEEELEATVRVKRKPPNVRKTFSRGAVIKLRLENFLTFDRVVLNPKPQLNVIVGPNGTGKSSIVCALCLGLAGSTTLLGRAKDLKDFVKHGKEKGFVEITLCDDTSSKHPVIRRTLSASSNSSEWTINRKPAQEKEVKKLVASLNVQIDNRCMFLPQDKVIEFARMNKQELLLETERAIGPKELYQHHEELKKLKSAHSNSHDNLNKMKKDLEDLQRVNNLLQRDVERFRNKEQYERKIKNLTYKKYWVLYEDARNQFDEKKKEKKEANNTVKTIKNHYQPIIDRQVAQEAAVDRYKTAAQESMKGGRVMENRLREQQEKLSALEDKMEEPRQELENAKREEETRKTKIGNLQREIEGFKRDLEELESTDSLNPKIAEKNARLGRVRQQINGLSDRQKELLAERGQHEEDMRQAEQQLQEMNNVWTQRLEKLRDQGTVRAIHWLKANQDLFRQPILEPVCMSLNMRDPRYAKQVEAFFSGRDFLSFVAQNEEDKERFLREVRDKMRLKVNIVLAPNRSLRDYQPVVPFHTLQGYKFQKMLLDVVEAPEPVLCHFCERHGLQHIPIAGNLRPNEITRITEELPKLWSFFTANMRYSVKRSLYSRNVSVRSSELFPARFLVASVDVQKKEELEQAIREVQQSLSQFDQDYQQLETQSNELRKEDAKLRMEKGALRKIVDTRKSHRSNITSRENRLAQYTQTTFNLKEAEEKCEREVNRIQEERVKCLSKLKELVQHAIASSDASIRAILNVRTAEARVSFTTRQFRQAKAEYEEAELRYKVLCQEVDELKENARRKLERASKESGVSKPEELKAAFNLLPNRLEEIEDQIHELRAQAEACVGTDQSVVDEFQQRERKIARLAKEISSRESDIENKDSRINDLKQRWLEPLKDLISRVNACFSSYFSTHMGMESAGMVQLDPDPEEHPNFSEFDKFGVMIKVKFRNVEELQELNAQRQSGGERSVSTMLYLMALQGTTSCPFRVVDEINQGMDPQNERRIFNLIVESAYHGAQYFLLTPKLLQSLDYSEAVSIHIVNNGQELLECDTWDSEVVTQYHT